MKIASVVGARPNFIKLAPVHKALARNPEIEHTIIHTGQHYDFEMSEIFFKEFKLPKPDINLKVGSGTPGYQTGEMIKRIEKVLLRSGFDLVMVYGDTNSTLAGALAAVGSKTRLAHVESGLRSFDRRMPEETNRVLTDHISNYLFASTRTAVGNLRKESVQGDIVYSGDLSVEIVDEAVRAGAKSDVLDRLSLEPKSYVLLTIHRVENTTASPHNLATIIKAIKALKDTTIVFPIHPRTLKAIKDSRHLPALSRCKNLRMIKPLGYVDFVKLARNASKIVTDSGGVQKEAFLLKVPCITTRRNTEWVETVDLGWNKLVGSSDAQAIIEAVQKWAPVGKKPRAVFGQGKASAIVRDRIVSLLESKIEEN
ncbi:non-hydrolyzing UDP-N-acetylglucosamine 2-epimerase [Nitrososphaera viennensis]|uniref:UDP-N-acetylglucosamine 2-epimerase n=2 Tax=Nitrososphaera viennensis TaxID=1034015 RepID=A0A060HEM0_9ARCH|nr:UDP-N-acetylglucosamine 2-epimerase (non-hydrolyzing) [Nitrososphaera viennensis]AIC15114.1 UDP-N-acetylglucosamine 2-epimerase [Nitrososphaera viennensis EN76]UVS70038.1 UDP-N-acetylglucosamine 2-epimerase (non-hydrolyzing) [Nitrososphaera viennensis]